MLATLVPDLGHNGGQSWISCMQFILGRETGSHSTRIRAGCCPGRVVVGGFLEEVTVNCSLEKVTHCHTPTLDTAMYSPG